MEGGGQLSPPALLDVVRDGENVPEAPAATRDWEVTLNLSHLLKMSEQEDRRRWISSDPHV